MNDRKDMTDDEAIEFIARVCHEQNKAYCELIGSNAVQPHWEDLDEETRNSCVAGVKFVLNSIIESGEGLDCGLDKLTPEVMHENWMKSKEKDGWVYGEVKDVVKKTHPNMVPYESLSKEEQFKDTLFSAAVVMLTIALDSHYNID